MPEWPPNASSHNCWNVGICPAGQHCYVKFKTAAAGFATCRADCPSDWLCETRVAAVQGTGAACGPAPLPDNLTTPTPEMHSVLSNSPWAGAVSICDRSASYDRQPSFEISCYDGGQTGNRYLMVRNLLLRAACCAGVALLPPSFDHLVTSGASCFDFRGLRHRASSAQDDLLAAAASPACATDVVASSKSWWSGSIVRATPPSCAESAELSDLTRATASLYAGFAVAGRVFRDVRCSAPNSATRTRGAVEHATAPRPSPPNPAPTTKPASMTTAMPSDTPSAAPALSASGIASASSSTAGSAHGSASLGLAHHPRTLMVHVRSGEIFSNWRDGRHVATHAGFQHEAFSRGQPPLAFYTAAALHTLAATSHAAASTSSSHTAAYTSSSHASSNASSNASSVAPQRLYGHVALATSPDRSNPVVDAMLLLAANHSHEHHARHADTHASSASSASSDARPDTRPGARPENAHIPSIALGVPITLTSSDSFAADLAHLLCATNLVLADSSLTSLLLDSPNLRNVYTFAPSACPPAVPCKRPSSGPSNESHHSSGGRPSPASPVTSPTTSPMTAPMTSPMTSPMISPRMSLRHWCVAPRASAGAYSVARRWENTAAQRSEMLTYGAHGGMAPPVLTAGPPLPCAGAAEIIPLSTEAVGGGVKV